MTHFNQLLKYILKAYSHHIPFFLHTPTSFIYTYVHASCHLWFISITNTITLLSSYLTWYRHNLCYARHKVFVCAFSSKCSRRKWRETEIISTTYISTKDYEMLCVSVRYFNSISSIGIADKNIVIKERQFRCNARESNFPLGVYTFIQNNAKCNLISAYSLLFHSLIWWSFLFVCMSNRFFFLSIIFSIVILPFLIPHSTYTHSILMLK